MLTPEVEQWRPIPGWPDYQVSDLGRVVSLKRRQPRVLIGGRNVKGYLTVGLYDGKTRTYAVHRLVLTAFRGPRPEGHEARHLDGDQTNNCLENLQWGTSSTNSRDQVIHGTHAAAAKTHCPQGHPYAGDNLYITTRRIQRAWGVTTAIQRHCRACVNAHSRAWRQRRAFAAASIRTERAA